MDYQVSLQNVRVSPRKANLFIGVIKGKNAQKVKNSVRFMPQKSAHYLYKLIASGIAAAEDRGADKDKLVIKTLKIDQAQPIKRILIKPKGSADQIKKRRSHFTLILTDEEQIKTRKEKANKNQKIDKRGKKDGSKSKSN